MEMTGLFAAGRLYLIRTPVDGRLGLSALHSRLVTGALGIDYDGESDEEIWVIMFNARRTGMRVLHVDLTGMTLITRRLWDGRFRVLLDGPELSHDSVTRGRLRRLLLDGTDGGEWRHGFLKDGAELLGME